MFNKIPSRVCSLTENKLKVLTDLGKQRFRVLKYEMVTEIDVYVSGPFLLHNYVYLLQVAWSRTCISLGRERTADVGRSSTAKL